MSNNYETFSNGGENNNNAFANLSPEEKAKLEEELAQMMRNINAGKQSNGKNSGSKNANAWKNQFAHINKMSERIARQPLPGVPTNANIEAEYQKILNEQGINAGPTNEEAENILKQLMANINKVKAVNRKGLNANRSMNDMPSITNAQLEAYKQLETNPKYKTLTNGLQDYMLEKELQMMAQAGGATQEQQIALRQKTREYQAALVDLQHQRQLLTHARKTGRTILLDSLQNSVNAAQQKFNSLSEEIKRLTAEATAAPASVIATPAAPASVIATPAAPKKSLWQRMTGKGRKTYKKRGVRKHRRGTRKH